MTAPFSEIMPSLKPLFSNLRTADAAETAPHVGAVIVSGQGHQLLSEMLASWCSSYGL